MISTWVKLHRKIADNPIMRHPVALQVLIWCMVKVQWKPYRHATRWGAVDLQPGEVMATRRHLASELGGTEQNIRTALALLAEEKIISILSTNTHSVITLVKWQDYQTDEEQLTSTQPALNQHSTQEQEGKKESLKKESKSKPLSALADPAQDADFMTFWRAWPKSVRRGTPKKAYGAWCKHKPPLQACLDTLTWKCKSKIWTDTDAQGKDFIPMPSSWIADWGWTEEKESGRGRGTGDGYSPRNNEPYEF